MMALINFEGQGHKHTTGPDMKSELQWQVHALCYALCYPGTCISLFFRIKNFKSSKTIFVHYFDTITYLSLYQRHIAESLCLLRFWCVECIYIYLVHQRYQHIKTKIQQIFEVQSASSSDWGAVNNCITLPAYISYEYKCLSHPQQLLIIDSRIYTHKSRNSQSRISAIITTII